MSNMENNKISSNQSLSQLGENLIKLGEEMLKPNLELRTLAVLARQCGLKIGISLEPIEGERNENSE